VKIQNDCSEYFGTRQGQGNVLPYLQCRIRINHVTSKTRNDRHLIKKQTQMLGYLDDIDIIGRSQAAVREPFLALAKDANKVGLKINESKTKYKIAARRD
jgi:hypothetical protein